MNYGKAAQQLGVSNMAGNCASIGVPESRAPELPAAAERLSNTISRLYDLADRLDGRLTGAVARNAGPVDVGSAAKAVMNTGFGAQLDEMNDRAYLIESRLSGLLDRLEF